MKFREMFVPKQIVFAIVVLAVFILLGLWDSATQVKVEFSDSVVMVDTDRYDMTIPYDLIETAELVVIPEAGVQIANGADDETLRTGLWENDTWGEHHICADLESDTCIVLRLTDGRIFVFTGKDSEETAQHFEMLQTKRD